MHIQCTCTDKEYNTDLRKWFIRWTHSTLTTTPSLWQPHSTLTATPLQHSHIPLHDYSNDNTSQLQWLCHLLHVTVSVLLHKHLIETQEGCLCYCGSWHSKNAVCTFAVKCNQLDFAIRTGHVWLLKKDSIRHTVHAHVHYCTSTCSTASLLAVYKHTCTHVHVHMCTCMYLYMHTRLPTPL